MRDTISNGKLLTHAAQGEGWARSCRFHAGDADETAISLVGATIEFYVGEAVYETVQGGEESDSVVITDAAGGEYDLVLTGDQTAALDVKRHDIECWITRSGAEPQQIFQGILEIHRTVRT